VTFAPSSHRGTIAPFGDSTIQVSGVFTLHGTPHDLTLPMQIHIDGANLTGHFAVGAEPVVYQLSLEHSWLQHQRRVPEVHPRKKRALTRQWEI
jgi:hypothetical protein